MSVSSLRQKSLMQLSSLNGRFFFGRLFSSTFHAAAAAAAAAVAAAAVAAAVAVAVAFLTLANYEFKR